MNCIKKTISYLCIAFVSFVAYAEPEFESSTGLLVLPTVRVDGVLYRNAEVILGHDGQWSIQAVDIPIETTNPVCDIDREIARIDALEVITEAHTPDFSTIEYVLNRDMEAYDAICKMQESSVLLEILNDSSESHYPDFSTILYVLERDLESLGNLNN